MKAPLPRHITADAAEAEMKRPSPEPESVVRFGLNSCGEGLGIMALGGADESCRDLLLFAPVLDLFLRLRLACLRPACV